MPTNEELAVIALDAFGFLADYSYESTSTADNAVEFENGSLHVHFSRDWRDGFIVLSFKRSDGSDGDSQAGGPLHFGLHHALQVVGAGDAWPDHGWQAFELPLAAKYTQELAGLVRNHAGPILNGDRDLWEAAHGLMLQQAVSSARRDEAGRLRVNANDAWAAQDWSAVLSLYGQLEQVGDELLDSERKRCAYAQHQIDHDI